MHQEHHQGKKTVMSVRASIGIGGHLDELAGPQTEFHTLLARKCENKKKSRKIVIFNASAKNESTKMQPVYVKAIQNTIQMANNKVSAALYFIDHCFRKSMLRMLSRSTLTSSTGSVTSCTPRTSRKSGSPRVKPSAHPQLCTDSKLTMSTTRRIECSTQ